MKKIFVLTVFTILFSSFQVNAKSYIEKEFQICIDERIDEVTCNVSATKKYNTEINLLLKKFKNKLPATQYAKLIESQTKWKKHNQGNLYLYEEIFNAYPTTNSNILNSELEKNSAKRRLEELSDFYNKFYTTHKRFSMPGYYN